MAKLANILQDKTVGTHTPLKGGGALYAPTHRSASVAAAQKMFYLGCVEVDRLEFVARQTLQGARWPDVCYIYIYTYIYEGVRGLAEPEGSPHFSPMACPLTPAHPRNSLRSQSIMIKRSE